MYVLNALQSETKMEQFHFSYSEFKSDAQETFKHLWKEEDFADVTLVSNDEVSLSSHKVILATASPILKRILINNPQKQPLIYFNGIGSSVLDQLVKFIYLGECEVEQDDLVSFLKAGKSLQIRGLTDEVEEAAKKSNPGDKNENPRVLDQLALERYSRQSDLDEQSFNDNDHLEEESIKVEVEAKEITKPSPRPAFEKKKKDISTLFKIDRIGGEDVRKIDQDISYSDMYQKKDGKYKCNQCDHVHVKKCLMVIHIRAVHERLKVSCELCDFQTGYKRALNDHMRIIHEGRLFQCKECNFTSRNRSSLSIHTTKHKFKESMWTTHKANIQCSKCDYESNSTKAMKKHIHENHLKHE